MISGKRCLVILLGIMVLAPLNAEETGSGEKNQIEEWRQILRYGIDGEILKVVDTLRRSGERDLNGELEELLRDSTSPEVRIAVLSCFSSMKWGEAEDTALELLKTGEEASPELQEALIRYLTDIESKNAVDLLIARIGSSDNNLAAEAIRALGRSASPQAGAALLAKLRDPDTNDRIKTDIVVALGELQYREAVEELMGIASNRDAEKVRRMYAFNALGKIGDERAIPVLKEGFAESDSLLKVYAASGLSFFRMSEVVDLLIQGLKDSNLRVRIAAAKALGNPEAGRAVEILKYKAQRDPERSVRLEAMASLGKIADTEAVDFLQQKFSDRRESLLYREASLSALLKGPLGASLPAIEKAVEEEWSSRSPEFLEMTARLLAEARERDAEVPGKLFARFLEHQSFLVRSYGIRGIAAGRMKEYRGRLEELSLRDPHPVVRQAALRTLGRF